MDFLKSLLIYKRDNLLETPPLTPNLKVGSWSITEYLKENLLLGECALVEWNRYIFIYKKIFDQEVVIYDTLLCRDSFVFSFKNRIAFGGAEDYLKANHIGIPRFILGKSSPEKVETFELEEF